MCGGCNAHNFATRDACYKCGMRSGKNPAQMMAPSSNKTFREGDWYCQCGQHNFASRASCYKCHSARPGGGFGGGFGGPPSASWGGGNPYGGGYGGGPYGGNFGAGYGGTPQMRPSRAAHGNTSRALRPGGTSYFAITSLSPHWEDGWGRGERITSSLSLVYIYIYMVSPQSMCHVRIHVDDHIGDPGYRAPCIYIYIYVCVCVCARVCVFFPRS